MIGDRLGKWVIFKELGRGGMGRVYLAQEELTGRQAAIKILAAELAQEVGFLQRFQREIETLSKLEHPNIVRFYESGLENGLYFYAMEYVEGPNLETILEKKGRIAWEDVLEIAMQVTPAIRHVHDHGVIHRDLKPSNLLLTDAGVIKLTDFGIAKIFASSHLTATGGIVGTAEYLSPEQAAGKIVGRRSDLYSLGCVLYALLTGHPPFTGKTYVELLHKHRYGQFDRPGSYVPHLPQELDDLVCQLLEKEPDKRPRDALVLCKQLDAIHRKLERKSKNTQADNRNTSTMAENRTDKIAMEALPGPATLMSRLVRAEVEKQKQGNLVSRFFNRPVVLVTLLALCIGIIAWTFWPMSEDALFAHGAKLMESESLFDMQRAFTDYLDPLEARYPKHAYKDKLAEYRRKLEAAKTPKPSEAQRFFQQGEFLRHQGNYAAAAQVWRSVIDVFEAADAEKEWVQRSRRALTDLEKVSLDRGRWKEVRAAIERAADLHRRGQVVEAERILMGIEQLYRNDPGAREILAEAARARGK